MKHIVASSNQLGSVLSARRKASKQSQRVLAGKLAISQNRLSELETDPGKINLDRLLAMTNALGLELVIQEKTTDRASLTEW